MKITFLARSFLPRTPLLALLVILAACSGGSDTAWSRSWGNRGHDLAFGLAADGDGNLYAGTQFSGQIEPQAGQTFTAQGHPDVLVMRFDPRGEPDWQTQFSSTRAVEVRDIAVARDGTVFATGYYAESLSAVGVKPLKAVTGADAWVAALQGDGTVRVLRGFGGKGADAGLALCALPDDGMLVAGTMQQAARFGEMGDQPRVLRAAGARDVFLVALDGKGNVRWAQLVGGVGDDRVIAMAPTPDGGCAALLGFQGTLTLGFGSTEQSITSRGGEDGLVLGVGADGALRFATPLGNAGPDFWDALTVATDGGLWVAGLAIGKNEYVFGDTRQVVDSAGSSDVLLVALDRAGRFLHARSFGNEAADTVHDLAASNDGRIVMAASGSGELQLDGHRLSAPLPQAYVASIGTDGHITGATLVRGDGITQPTALTLPAPGRVAVLGMFETALLTADEAKPLKANGKTDAFLALRAVP